MTIKRIDEARSDCPPGLIDMLEDLTQKAKEGKLLSVVIVGETSTKGRVLMARSINRQKSNIYGLIGAMEAFKTDILHDFHEFQQIE